MRDGKTSFRGHGGLAYDGNEKRYAMHWPDSMGTSPNIYKGNVEGVVTGLVVRAGSGTSPPA